MILVWIVAAWIISNALLALWLWIVAEYRENQKEKEQCRIYDFEKYKDRQAPKAGTGKSKGW